VAKLNHAVALNLFYLATHLTPIFFATHLNLLKHFCATPVLYFIGQILVKTHYNSLFYNLAAHLEGTRCTLLYPGTVVENHWLDGIMDNVIDLVYGIKFN
jgi:hypothetical protein